MTRCNRCKVSSGRFFRKVHFGAKKGGFGKSAGRKTAIRPAGTARELPAGAIAADAYCSDVRSDASASRLFGPLFGHADPAERINGKGRYGMRKAVRIVSNGFERLRELLTRLELVTSSLPRKCSTTELQQQLLHWSGAKVRKKNETTKKIADLVALFSLPAPKPAESRTKKRPHGRCAVRAIAVRADGSRPAGSPSPAGRLRADSKNRRKKSRRSGGDLREFAIFGCRIGNRSHVRAPAIRRIASTGPARPSRPAERPRPQPAQDDPPRKDDARRKDNRMRIY